MRARVIWVVVLLALAAAACSRKPSLYLDPGEREPQAGANAAT